ncbi:MAG TPA: hypothetical protein VL492_04115 [Methylovirgula sp.]|jgi:hypothetical protein|nr:hypothetical protein [Methylovirgula sp.]
MKVLKWSTALFLLSGLMPVAAQSFHGVTCDDVRALSKAEQDYWSERLHLTSEQKHRIYVTCYQHYHPGQNTVAEITK